jgi:Zn-dependent protease with chaperone function
MALPLERMVLFTTGALQRVSPDGLKAIALHELAHLQERPAIMFLRALPRLLAVAIVVVVGLAPPDQMYVWFIALFVAVFASRFILVRVSLSKERDADRAAFQDEFNKGDHARALLDLHQAFLMPATLPKRSTHPSLYDRLISADVVPDFPRPAPPARMPAVWTIMIAGPLMLIVAQLCLGG